MDTLVFAFSYQADFDLNMNGITGFDLGDESIVSANHGRSFAPGELSDRGNIVGWCGYLYEESTGMWLARHRWQIPELGRWANRDPIGYAGGGQNLYEYVNGNPVFLQDPMGLSPNILEIPHGDMTLPVESLEANRNACHDRYADEIAYIIERYARISRRLVELGEYTAADASKANIDFVQHLIDNTSIANQHRVYMALIVRSIKRNASSVGDLRSLARYVAWDVSSLGIGYFGSNIIFGRGQAISMHADLARLGYGQGDVDGTVEKIRIARHATRAAMIDVIGVFGDIFELYSAFTKETRAVHKAAMVTHTAVGIGFSFVAGKWASAVFHGGTKGGLAGAAAGAVAGLSYGVGAWMGERYIAQPMIEEMEADEAEHGRFMAIAPWRRGRASRWSDLDYLIEKINQCDQYCSDKE